MKLDRVARTWRAALVALVHRCSRCFVYRRPALGTAGAGPGDRRHRSKHASITPALFGIGTVEARYTYAIGPTVAGRVKRVDVSVGDRVRAGRCSAKWIRSTSTSASPRRRPRCSARAGDVLAAEAQVREAAGAPADYAGAATAATSSSLTEGMVSARGGRGQAAGAPGGRGGARRGPRQSRRRAPGAGAHPRRPRRR